MPPCMATRVDVLWSSRDRMPRVHCVPGLPSQKPREQQRGVLRPAVLQAPQPKVLSQTGKGPSHSLKSRGKGVLRASSVLGSPDGRMGCCPLLVNFPRCALSPLQSTFQAACGSLGFGPVIQKLSSGVDWDLAYAWLQCSEPAHRTLEDSCFVCLDLGASRMAWHVRGLPLCLGLVGLL